MASAELAPRPESLEFYKKQAKRLAQGATLAFALGMRVIICPGDDVAVIMVISAGGVNATSSSSVVEQNPKDAVLPDQSKKPEIRWSDDEL